MLRTFLSSLISAVLLLGPAAHLVAAHQQTDKQATTVDAIKIQVGKLGLGAKARATIKLKDGTKTKGYVASASADDFVIRDRKIDTATTIRYADVARVESNKGHSTAKHLGIGLGIGAAATVGILFIIISRLDD